ncbi:MAG: ribosome small subunit-dependent GTPase A [Thiobacillaceae bacterium]
MAAHGRRFIVESPGGNRTECATRGRKSDAVCGDQVEFSVTSPGAGVIDRILPRSSLFYRSDRFHTKAIAANVTLVVIVAAPVPSFSVELIQRCLVAAESQQLSALILLNKSDLPEHHEAYRRLQPLSDLGYPLIGVCATQDVAKLRSAIEGHTSLLVGQSGMGKSTLLNALVPNVQARTREISHFLDSGKHTTSHSELYRLSETTSLIDSPGLQEFALAHLDQAALEQAFPDFRPFLGKCRFRDCHHTAEPDCALTNAVAEGLIAKERLKLFRLLLAESSSHRL